MCYAIIDLGSNTIRLCVYDYAGGVINTIVNQKETGGLAGYVTSGILSQDGIEKACEILNAHIALAKKLVDKSNIHILATASLRNIDNREEAVEAIYRKTEMLPEVLTGEEEALLDFIGASYHINYQRGLLIDIGGASTELVLFDNHEPVALASMPIGCLTLYRKYVENIFPSQEEEKQIKREVLRFLQETNLQKDCPIVIGVGGSVKAVNKLARVLFPETGDILEADIVKKLHKRFKNPDQKLLDAVYKTIPERTLTIVPGLILLKQAIKFFGSQAIHVNEYGLREGYLLDRILGVKKEC
ncbi:MAG: phosphatase [Clostridiales bacterium]